MSTRHPLRPVPGRSDFRHCNRGATPSPYTRLASVAFGPGRRGIGASTSAALPGEDHPRMAKSAFGFGSRAPVYMSRARLASPRNLSDIVLLHWEGRGRMSPSRSSALPRNNERGTVAVGSAICPPGKRIRGGFRISDGTLLP